MKLHTATKDKALLSNVGTVNTFAIKATAKSFRILSDGLYANKIRAIIRELSCNAYDSHIGAGKGSVPFDVHLPNTLEPWFSVRDYGLGLSHDQVVNIFTTFFESTKTDSNDFVGALGLGSKSPFSYTDNFTVTSVKDNRKGVYTAFINDQGVPSIALMMEEQTNDPNGLEVKFAVEGRNDFERFSNEAQYVYETFKLRPVVSGNAHFKFKDPAYKDKDIVKGIHYLGDGANYGKSYAVMGNIKYPIDVPNPHETLGDLYQLLRCGLMIEFDIGELDFQASREGLSYIKQTNDAIKKKLQKLNARLADYIKEHADKITNLWERAYYLQEKFQETLYANAVSKYAKDSNFQLFNDNRYDRVKKFSFTPEELAAKYNLNVRGFIRTRGYDSSTTIKPHVEYENVNGTTIQKSYHRFSVTNNTVFICNDTNIGALERAKYHFKDKNLVGHSGVHVYVLEAFDKKKPMNTARLFLDICSPPEKQILKASELRQKERASNIKKNVTILRLARNTERRRSSDYTWKDAGKIDDFCTSTTFYYLPLSGFKNVGLVDDVKSLCHHLSNSGLLSSDIYGVRKTDIEDIKSRKNWVNLDEHMKTVLNNLKQTDVLGAVKSAIKFDSLYRFNAIKNLTNVDSPYVKLYRIFEKVRTESENKHRSIEALCEMYKVKNNNINFNQLVGTYTKMVSDINRRYPLLASVSYIFSMEAIAEYINMIDEKKGV